MAKGGFRRLVKVTAQGLVVDHRPVDPEHPEVKASPQDWHEVTVPVDIPVTLNDGIRDGTLQVKDGAVTWDPAAEAIHWAAQEAAKATSVGPDRLDALEARLAALEQAVKP